MAIIYSADLNNANSSTMTKNLTSISNNSRKLISSINNFIESSKTELIGSGYDAVRAKMSLYLDALNKQADIADNLKTSIYNANNNMLNFMEGYSMLDDSRIPEVNGRIRTVEALIAKLEGTEEANPNDIAALRQLLSELRAFLAKLEKLAPADALAFGIVSSVATDVHRYGNALLNLSVPNIDGTVSNNENASLGNKLKGIESEIGTSGAMKTEEGVVVFNQKGYYDESNNWHDWSEDNRWAKHL